MSKLSDFSDEFIQKLKNAGGNLYRDFVAELNSLPVFKPITPQPARKTKAQYNGTSIIEDPKIISKLKRKNTISNKKNKQSSKRKRKHYQDEG